MMSVTIYKSKFIKHINQIEDVSLLKAIYDLIYAKTITDKDILKRNEISEIQIKKGQVKSLEQVKIIFYNK